MRQILRSLAAKIERLNSYIKVLLVFVSVRGMALDVVFDTFVCCSLLRTLAK